MTAHQYWEEDCWLVKYYREADKIRRDRDNEEMWLQGMYIYDTLTRLAPLFMMSPKKGSKPKAYVEKPYPLDGEQVEEELEKKEKDTEEKGLRYMYSLMGQDFNKKKE